jgi:integrase
MPTATRRRTRRGFGAIRKLPSGRYQAHYIGPDRLKHAAGTTFTTRGDAEAWLSMRQAEVTRGVWLPPTATRPGAVAFSVYAQGWLNGRDLKPRTREHYAQLIANQIEPTFGPMPLSTITPSKVRDWHSQLDRTRPTLRAHAYALLRTILGTAVSDEIITTNPCHIRGAGTARRVHNTKPASLAELEALVTAMPDRLKVMTLLAAWLGLRFGELVELRRKDVDLGVLRVHIRRGAVRANGKVVIGTPKSAAGIRDVSIPPHLDPLIRRHLAEHAQPGRDGLLFPAANGGTLAPSSLYTAFYPARKAAGRPDLRWHDLRHTGAVLAASTGATLAELMARLGHSTPAAALRYQHAAQDRDRVIAEALSRLVESGT